jgi:hypothetical protein
MSEIEWREAPSLPGYWVSSAGEIRGPSGKIRKQQVNIHRNNYRQFGVRQPDGKARSVKVHRLVCLAFHGPQPSSAHEVAHNDGDPGNNTAANLRWATRSENHLDKRRHGTSAQGERSGRARLTDVQVLAIRQRFADGESQSEIARSLGIGLHLVWQVVRRVSWNHL